MLNRVKLAQYPLEHSVRPVSFTRDRTTLQIRLRNRWLLFFLKTKSE